MIEVLSVNERVQQYLNEPVWNLPVFDRNARLVRQEAEKSRPDGEKMVQCILQDQVLTAEVLSLANASFFQGIKKIGHIQEAIARIGLPGVMECVTAAAERTTNTESAFVRQYMTDLWRHSVVCGYGAQWLVRRCGREDLVMDAYIAGLLHDMGKLLVLKALISVIENDKDTIRLTKVVADEFLDAMHAEYGFSLLSKWNLPEAYCDICKNHHLTRYDTTNTLLTAVRLANQACCKLGFGIHHDKDLQLETSLEASVLSLSDIALAELEIAMEDYVARMG